MKLFQKESPRVLELTRKIDEIGAQANAQLKNIDRKPDTIDHLSVDYPKAPRPMNGVTEGIKVRLLGRDQFCQVLQVEFGMQAFAPAHKHPHYSVCFVACGEIIDTVRDNKRFDKGDWFLVSPMETHSSQSMSGATVKVFNTTNKMVADSIMNNKGYDPKKIHP